MNTSEVVEIIEASTKLLCVVGILAIAFGSRVRVLVKTRNDPANSREYVERTYNLEPRSKENTK